MYTPTKKVSSRVADFSCKTLIFKHPKNVLRFEKSYFFNKFLLRIMGNAFKGVFVQKFHLTLILQGSKVKDLKTGILLGRLENI